MATFQVYFGVLVCLSGQTCSPKEVVGTKPYFSRATCEEDERLIAQAMFVKSGVRYGFKCVLVDYEPPKVP